MAETELHEKIVLEGAEAAEGKLHGLAGAVGRVAGAFEGMTEIASTLGGIGAAWKLAEGLHEVDALYGAVSRISRTTGIAAEQAHGMFEAFEKSGVDMESAESVMVSMARMAGKLGGSVSVTAKEAEAMNRHMLSLGVNIKKGPVDQMLQMSEAASAGKLQMNDMVRIFGVQRSQAERMFLLLKKGPEKLKEIFEEVKNSSGVIDAAALESYSKMKAARNELNTAWHGVTQTLYKAVIPAVTAVLVQIKSGFDAIAPIAEKIGRVLSDHMTTVVALTKTWIGLMAANKAVNFVAPMLGGKKMGLLGEGEEAGRLMTWGKKAMGFLGNTKHGKAGAMDFFEARAAFPAAGKAAASGVGMFETVGGPLTRILGSVAGKFGIIGLVISAVVGAFMILKNNTLGIRDAFVRVFKGIGEVFSGVITKIVAVFKALEPVIKVIAGILGGVLLGALYVVSIAVEALGWVLDKVMIAVVGLLNGIIWLYNKTLAHVPFFHKMDMIDLDAKKAKTAAEAKDKTGEKGAGDVVNQDFRGSKFDIQNNFDKGVDGGRVSVAFGDSMAKLGERRIDSSLRPIYSYR